MTSYESYLHSVDCICKRYFQLNEYGEDGSCDLEELLAYAQWDHFLHSVKAYINIKYPEVYADFFSYLDDEEDY